MQKIILSNTIHLLELFMKILCLRTIFFLLIILYIHHKYFEIQRNSRSKFRVYEEILSSLQGNNSQGSKFSRGREWGSTCCAAHSIHI
jgi:hypothetical protein